MLDKPVEPDKLKEYLTQKIRKSLQITFTTTVPVNKSGLEAVIGRILFELGIHRAYMVEPRGANSYTITIETITSDPCLVFDD